MASRDERLLPLPHLRGMKGCTGERKRKFFRRGAENLRETLVAPSDKT